MVAIRLAILRGEDEPVFRLAEDGFLAGFDADEPAELPFWFLRDIGTRYPVRTGPKGVPKWAIPYAARYQSGVRLVRIWSVEFRYQERDAEVERLRIAIAEGE